MDTMLPAAQKEGMYEKGRRFVVLSCLLCSYRTVRLVHARRGAEAPAPIVLLSRPHCFIVVRFMHGSHRAARREALFPACLGIAYLPAGRHISLHL